MLNVGYVVMVFEFAMMTRLDGLQFGGFGLRFCSSYAHAREGDITSIEEVQVYFSRDLLPIPSH